MNYFAHGRAFLDNPLIVAGAALPDWLCVVDRRIRIRSHQAGPFLAEADPAMASFAWGIMRHHYDDAWFHHSTAFAELSLALCGRVRDLLRDQDGLRPYFLGHILVEILLDAALIDDCPAALEAYYAAIGSLDPAHVEGLVTQIAARPAPRLAEFIRIFLRERFLSDYADDAKLLVRLNQVMRRVKLPPLPERLMDLLPEVRLEVGKRKNDLLEPPAGARFLAKPSIKTPEIRPCALA